MVKTTSRDLAFAVSATNGLGVALFACEIAGEVEMNLETVKKLILCLNSVQDEPCVGQRA